MALIKVSTALLEHMLFGFSQNPVKVEGVESAGDGSVVFKISGEDVPEDAREVTATLHQQQNRAGQRFTTMFFEKRE